MLINSSTMQSTTAFFLLIVVAVPCLCQRPFYAGLRPIGYPDVQTSAPINELFGEDLPAILNGDTAYANRLDQLPEAQQPFWYLNRKQYEEQLRNPQTYPQRPSIFNENSG